MSNDGKFGYQPRKPIKKKGEADSSQNQVQQGGQASTSGNQPTGARSVPPTGGAAISSPKKD